MILHGDCINKIKELDDNSVDAIVTDPPYELGFMGKKMSLVLGLVNIHPVFPKCGNR
jgi:DNA modification methylase